MQSALAPHAPLAVRVFCTWLVGTNCPHATTHDMAARRVEPVAITGEAMEGNEQYVSLQVDLECEEKTAHCVCKTCSPLQDLQTLLYRYFTGLIISRETHPDLAICA